jgi:hypothetical protein
MAKSWLLQEKSRLGAWTTINTVAEAPRALEVTEDVQKSDLHGPRAFPENIRFCGGQFGAPMEFEPDANASALMFTYTPVAHTNLLNIGHGVQIDGDFGTLSIRPGGINSTLPAEEYDAKQIHIHLPTYNRMKGTLAQDAPVGEFHILHQSPWVLGVQTKLVVLTVLLALPQEGTDPGTEELFFRSMGLEDLPAFGYPRQIVTPIDLSSLGNHLASPTVKVGGKVPCSEADFVSGKIQWYIASSYAHVSGSVVLAFQNMFSVPLNYDSAAALATFDPDAEAELNEAGIDANLSLNNSTEGFLMNNTTGGYWTPFVIKLSETQEADAYASGDWRNQFNDPTPAPAPAPAPAEM